MLALLLLTNSKAIESAVSNGQILARSLSGKNLFHASFLISFVKKYSDQLSTTALVRRNATKNLENSCFILN